MLNTNEPETNLPHKPRHKFVTETMVQNNEPETCFCLINHVMNVTQTMLNTNEPEIHLPHKPCYKFVIQTMVKNNELETYFCLINHIINLSHKPC